MTRDIRQQIVELASEKFYKNGFTKISMDSLVDELRISKSTLYKYFPSKEELIVATVKNYTDSVDRKFEELLSNEDLTVMEIMNLFTPYYSQIMSRICEEYLRELHLNYPEYWDELVAGRIERFMLYFGKIYDIGMKQGIFRQDIPKDIVIYIYAKATEIPYTDYVEHLNIPRNDVFNAISEIFFRGALTEKGMEELNKHQSNGRE